MTLDQLKDLTDQLAILKGIEADETNLASSDKKFGSITKLVPSMLSPVEQDELAEYIEGVLKAKIADRKNDLAQEIGPILNVS